MNNSELNPDYSLDIDFPSITEGHDSNSKGMPCSSWISIKIIDDKLHTHADIVQLNLSEGLNVWN